MAEHVKIKCKNEKDYEMVKDILGMTAIEFYQKAPGKAIHLCGFDKKKEIEKLLDSYGLKKIKVKTESPDFDKVAEGAERAMRRFKEDMQVNIEENKTEDDYEDELTL